MLVVRFQTEQMELALAVALALTQQLTEAVEAMGRRVKKAAPA